MKRFFISVSENVYLKGCVNGRIIFTNSIYKALKFSPFDEKLYTYILLLRSLDYSPKKLVIL